VASPESKTRSKSKSRVISDVKTLMDVKTKTKTKTKTDTISIGETVTTTKNKGLTFSMPLINVPLTFPTPFIAFKGAKEPSRQGSIFLGQVRKGGRFVTVGTGAKSFVAGEASRLVETTPLASVRVVSARTGEVVGGKGLFSSVFRSSKRDQGVYVEKNAFRIDTAGEIGGISKKGGKKKKRGLGIWDL